MNYMDLHLITLAPAAIHVASEANRAFRTARSGEVLPCHARSLREEAERLDRAAATLREAATFAELRLVAAE